MQQQFSDRVRMARRKAGLSQSKAAQDLGVHRGTFGHWERGAGHRPTNANLQHLALLMCVSYEWLATGRGSMHVSPAEVAAVRLDCFAQSEDEEQLLLALRKLPKLGRLAVVNFARSLIDQPLSQLIKPAMSATPTASAHSTLSFLKTSTSGASA